MALSEIEKLEARFNENPDGRFFAPLADAYRKAGRVDDALLVVQDGIQKHPDYLSAHIVLGRCHLDRKDDAAALLAFESVLGLDSENIIALKSLADISERLGQTDGARRWLMRLLGVDPMNSEAEADLARLGGPIADGVAAPAAEPEAAGISFADLTAPDLETAPMPALDITPRSVLDAPEEVEAVSLELPTEPMISMEEVASSATLEFVPPVVSMQSEPAAAPLELESVSFQPPSESEAPAHLEGVSDFDDSLGWGGAGERMSHSIRQEDLAEVELKHEETTSAFEFMSAAAPAEMVQPEPPEPDSEPAGAEDVAAPPAAEWSAAGEGSTMEIPPVTVAEAAADSGPGQWTGEVGGVTGEFESDQADLMAEEAAAFADQAEAGAEETAAVADRTDESALPLIMPEDVTPPEEMRRPSVKLMQVSDAESAEAAGEPLLTETMAELYLKQGLAEQAMDVYRRLIAQRPDDQQLQARLAALEAPRPSLSAAALGGESVGTFLSRIARAALATRAAPPPAPATGPSPMEQAFAGTEPETEPAEPADGPAPPVEAAPGQPARQATEAFSLDQIFGKSQQAPAPAPTPAQAQASNMGSSFDEFFGGQSAPEESVRPRESRTQRGSEDDLSSFNAWLHGLKR